MENTRGNEPDHKWERVNDMEDCCELNHFNVEESTIGNLQSSMEKGELSARGLVMYYLHRIARYD